MQWILPILIVIHVVPGIFGPDRFLCWLAWRERGLSNSVIPKWARRQRPCWRAAFYGVSRMAARLERSSRFSRSARFAPSQRRDPKRHRLARNPSPGRGERSGTQSSSGSYRLQPAGRCGPAGDHDHLHVGRTIHLMPPIHVASVNPRTSPESAAFG